MIVLHRKKILLSIAIIMMFTFTYIITGYNVSKSKNNIDTETVQTVALPVDNKTIILDAGHGVPDEGAESSTRNNRSRK